MVCRKLPKRGNSYNLEDNPVLNSEIWKDVVGFEGVYQVSDLGRVRNSRGMIMKFFTNNSGYFCIKLSVGNGKTKGFLAHRLVAAAFLGEPEGNLVVNHINFDRLDNRLSNLEWCSTSENLEHSRAAGRMPPSYGSLGKKLSGGRKGSSEYHGVFRQDYKYKGKTVEKWRAYLCVEGRNLETKSYPTELEAAKYYDHMLDKYNITNKPRNF